MHSREDSGVLYLQSALVGVMSCLGCSFAWQSGVSGVEAGVPTQWKLSNRVRTGM